MVRWRLLTVLGLSVALITACGSTNGQDTQLSSTLMEYAEAQDAYTRMDTDTSPTAVTQAWVDDKSTKLARVRQTFEAFRAEAEITDFPQRAGEPGQPSQATIDEFIAATDALISFDEDSLAQVQDCTERGGLPYDCVMRVGAQLIIGAYPEILTRAQNAALQLQVESGRA